MKKTRGQKTWVRTPVTRALSGFQVPKTHGFTRSGFISLSLHLHCHLPRASSFIPGWSQTDFSFLRLPPVCSQLGTDSGLGGHRVILGIQVSLGGQGKNHLPSAVPAWCHTQNRHSANTLGMNPHQPGPETCPLPRMFPGQCL